MGEIAKFGIWAENRNSQFWMEFGRKWGKNDQPIAGKCHNWLQSLTIVTINGDYTMLLVSKLIQLSSLFSAIAAIFDDMLRGSSTLATIVGENCDYSHRKRRLSSDNLSLILGYRQTICLQLTRVVCQRGKTCWLHNKNLVYTSKAL